MSGLPGRSDISCLIPAHNEARHILQAVRSVLDQTCPPGEVIVYDDASTDDTAHVLAQIRDNRVRVIGGPVGVGRGAARNALLIAARGSWLAWQDADDWSAPTRFQRQAEFLRENALIGCGTALMMIREKAADEPLIPTVGPRAVRELQTTGEIGCFGATLMFHRSVVEEGLRFEPSADVAEDLLFQLEIQARYPLGLDNIPDVLYSYRIRSRARSLSRRRRAAPEFALRLATGLRRLARDPS